MKLVVLTGTKNGVNVTFTLPETSVGGGVTLIAHTNIVLHIVASAPVPGECTVSGATVVVGLAPAAADPLYAYITTVALTSLEKVGLTGDQDEVNVTYTLPQSVPAGTNLVGFLAGNILEETTGTPTIGQFRVVGVTLTLGLAPEWSDEVAFYREVAGTTMSKLSVATFTTETVLPLIPVSGSASIFLVIYTGIHLTAATEWPSTSAYTITETDTSINIIFGLAPEIGNRIDIYLIGAVTVPPPVSTGETSLIPAGSMFLGKVFNTGVVAVASSTLASSTVTTYLAASVIDWRYPRRTWRSTTTAAQTITLDLGATAASHVGIYLRGANFVTATLMANATNVWTAPTISKGVTIPRDAFLDRYHTMVFWDVTRTVVAYRYIRLAIPSQTPTDGASYFALGAMLPVIVPVEVEIRAPIQVIRHQAMLSNELPTRQEVQRVGERQMILTLPWNYAWDQVLDSSNNETDLMHALAVSEDEPVIVCWNTRKPELAILARREGEIVIDSANGVGASMPTAWVEII